MKTKRFETVIIIITFICVSLTVGFFVGKSHGQKTFSVKVEENGGEQGADDEEKAVLDNVVQISPVETAGTDEKSEDEEKININTAAAEELQQLDGIGEVLAGRIVEFREENGPFLTIEEIMNVSGIGEGKFAGIKDCITVE